MLWGEGRSTPQQRHFQERAQCPRASSSPDPERLQIGFLPEMLNHDPLVHAQPTITTLPAGADPELAMGSHDPPDADARHPPAEATGTKSGAPPRHPPPCCQPCRARSRPDLQHQAKRGSPHLAPSCRAELPGRSPGSPQQPLHQQEGATEQAVTPTAGSTRQEPPKCRQLPDL